MIKRNPKLSTYSLWRNVLATLQLYWQIDKTAMMFYLFLASLQVISSILSVFFTSRIISELTFIFQDKPVPTERIYVWLASLGLSIIVERFAWRWMNFTERKTWIKWYIHMAIRFNSVVSSLDMPQHHNADFEKTLTKLQQQYQYIPQNFANNILQFIHNGARLISVLIIVVSFAPWLVLIMIASLVPGFLTEQRLSKVQWNLWGTEGDSHRFAWRTTYYLQDKNKLQETKLFGTRNFLLNRLRKLYDSFYNKQLKNLKGVQLPAFGSLLSETLVIIGINFWLIHRVITRSLSLGNFSFYSGIIAQFGGSLSLMVQSLTFLYDQNQYMKDLYKFFDMQPVLPQASPTQKLSPEIIPTIEFQDVSFQYPNSKKWALKNISFILKPGDKVAFVGENGAGKTTIIRLLLRFYDPSEGKVLINGTNIQEIDLTSYYNHVGVLFQDFNDYPYSVRDNIALGRVESFDDEERVRRAARLANADDFIEQYPEKYDQLLEVGFKKGIEPSGGQWQRLALARALFRDAGILVLDEPTASVDAKSEYAIFKTLEEHSQGRTTIVISHRFSTVRTAKKIYVIDKGKFIESGTHQSLIEITNGLYKEMFEKQAAGYR